jgi:hypothetical protein
MSHSGGGTGGGGGGGGEPAPRGAFVGPLQQTHSRLPLSRVWALTTRPGPGTYQLHGSTGRQADSTKVTMPYTHFGSEEKKNSCLQPSYSKGAIYRQSVSMGKQSEGHRRTEPRMSFGTSTRAHHDVQYTAFSYKPH